MTYGFGEHLLTDAPDVLAESGEADGAVLFKNFQHEHGPFVGDTFDDFANEAIDFRAGLRRRRGPGEPGANFVDFLSPLRGRGFHLWTLSFGCV